MEKQSYTKVRREREKELRKRAIMNAALKLFAQFGYEDTTVDMIAEKSELSKGLVYFYFQSKEHILSEIIREYYTPLVSRLEDVVQEYENPLDKFKAFIQTGLEFYAQNPDLAKVLFTVMTPHQVKKLKAQYQHTFTELHKIVAKVLDNILKEGIETGTFKDVNLDLLRIFIIGPVHELVQPDKIKLLRDPSVRNQIVEAYVTGIIKARRES